MQLAFTAAGLRAMGLEEAELRTFPQDFLEGMARRAEQLGDRVQDVAAWQFGREEGEVHLLLAVYAPSEEAVDGAVAALRGSASGVRVVREQRAAWSEREPFGFRDGISQPAIARFPETEGARICAEDAPVQTGEFLLGYPNEYGELPISPHVSPRRDPREYLGGEAPRDLGLNGTFMVVRKLRQDVEGFHAFLGDQARRLYGADDEPHRTLLAAKMMGRWPNGAPIQEGQTEEPSIRPGEENAFLFSSPRASGCPMGAHVRRANPRDSLASGDRPSPDEVSASLAAVRRHRLIRRVVRWREGAEEGILFIALNASIQRQFEYVHRSWLRNEKIGTAVDEKDPLMSTGRGERFTIPDAPARKRVTGLPELVRTLGGAYFFLPSLSALRFLSNLPS
ncbi:MAG TPA: peroxidase [Myxococcales bacterium]|nr:peroxidase [Myxococcales bacterium]